MPRLLTGLALAALALAGGSNAQLAGMLGELNPSEMMGLGAGAASSLVSTLEAKVSGVSFLIGGLLSDTATVASTSAQAAGAAISQGAASVDALYQAYRGEYCSPPAYAPGELVPTNFTTPGFSLTFSLGNCELDAGARSLECVAPSVRYSQSPAVLTSAHVRPAFFVGEVCRASATFGTADRRVIAVLDPKKPKEMPTPAFLAGTLADEVVTTFQDAARGAGSAIEAALPGGAAPALFGGPGGGAATTTAAVGGADAGVAATSAGGRK